MAGKEKSGKKKNKESNKHRKKRREAASHRSFIIQLFTRVTCAHVNCLLLLNCLRAVAQSEG